MNEEMRTEAMELCVTACEKFSANNEVYVTNILIHKFLYLLFVMLLSCWFDYVIFQNSV